MAGIESELSHHDTEPAVEYAEEPAAIDTVALKANFAEVAAHGGDEIAHHFYSYLFLRYPETRAMFPPAMTRQRDRLVGASGRIVADTMVAAADKLAESEPAWWDADVIGVDARTFDIAVLTVRTTTPHTYLAGQSISVEPTDLRPREWRLYTPATAPGGLVIKLHARLISGGPVSTALVRSASAGDRLRLGPPFGRMVLDPGSDRPILMIAGGRASRR